MGKDKEIWFPAKRYGVGWGLPVTWQGWVVLAAFLLLLLAGGALSLTGSPAWIVFFPPYAIALVAGLLFVCLKRGEKLDFRWGRRK